MRGFFEIAELDERDPVGNIQVCKGTTGGKGDGRSEEWPRNFRKPKKKEKREEKLNEKNKMKMEIK